MDILKVCRLCLNVIHDDDFDLVESDITQMLEKLLLKLNLGISRLPIICNECATNLQDCFDFKLKCLNSENMILHFRDTKETSILDLREVYLHENQHDESDISDQKVCRFCMNVTKCDFTQLYDTKENIFMVSMLQKYIPELHLNITEEIITCKSCFDALQCFYSFITKCIDAEEKITKYADTAGTDTEGHIELNTIAKFTYNSDTLRKINVSDDCEKYDSKCFKIKTENISEENETDVSIKTEVVDMKGDVSEDVSQDTSAAQGDVPMYKCQECPFKSKYRQSLANHRVIHQSEVETYGCDACSYKTKFKFRLKRHSLIHKDPSELNMFSCRQCAFSTRLLANLLRHEIIHKSPSEVVMYKCKLCSYETKFKWDLKTHEINYHNPKTRMFKCTVCSYAANLKRYLNKHMLVHKSPSEVTMYKCPEPECTFSTKYKDGLQRHSHVHKNPAELTMFKCESCSYKATKLSNLKRHLISHKHPSEVMLFQCDKCAYKTKHKHDLSKHNKIHPDPTELTVYKCEKCPYVTRYKRSLLRHIGTKCGAKTGQ